MEEWGVQNWKTGIPPPPLQKNKEVQLWVAEDNSSATARTHAKSLQSSGPCAKQRRRFDFAAGIDIRNTRACKG